MEEMYARMTDTEKQGFDLALDYGLHEAAEKLLKDKEVQMTESEKIEHCLQCQKSDCDNCFADLTDGKSKKTERLYEWRGQLYSLQKLLEISGRSKSDLIYRIKTGGVDFAMSASRNLEEWKKGMVKNV